MDRTKIAVFLDVENLPQWIKHNGPEKLLSELSSTGTLIVRRAYGKWTNPNLQSFQGQLNRQGFELIQNFHPVSGKNSSDIQLTVDVMEYALRLNDVDWFVLATGDSDFSPLFRRLREMGKEVVGVGPRSPLSESVKTSCTRYIYTDKGELTNKEVLHSALDDAIDLAEQALQTFDGPALRSALKGSMINMDSAFDEKSLGFKSFTDFLKTIDAIHVNFDSKARVWRASFTTLDDQVTPKNAQEPEAVISTDELYRRFLRKKKWRSVPKKLLVEIYQKISEMEPSTRNDIVEALLPDYSSKDVTSADIKKAISTLMKAHLFGLTTHDDQEEPDDKLWWIERKDDFIRDVDRALLARLLSAVAEANATMDEKIISEMLYGKYNQIELRKLLSDAMLETT